MKPIQAPALAQPMSASTPSPELVKIRVPIESLVGEVAKVIVGKRPLLELVAAAIVTEGAHILFEDLPGLGKSVMAATFSKASGSKFKRVQFTPDLLPSDITGTYVLNQKVGKFDFHEGPIFTNFLLADEINRASPKTQSALLEAMAEKQVSIEGVTHRLPRPFLVLATQNPVDQEGTYPLPEAQLDRFMLKLTVGQPNLEEESEILTRRDARRKDDFDVKPVTSIQTLTGIQEAVERIRVDKSIIRYISAIVVATRRHPNAQVGASPRGSLALLKLSKAVAAIRGRHFVVPDDVKTLSEPVLAHRLILRPSARAQGVTPQQVVRECVDATPVPKI